MDFPVPFLSSTSTKGILRGESLKGGFLDAGGNSVTDSRWGEAGKGPWRSGRALVGEENLKTTRILKTTTKPEGWEGSSVAHLPGWCRALGSLPVRQTEHNYKHQNRRLENGRPTMNPWKPQPGRFLPSQSRKVMPFHSSGILTGGGMDF